MKSLVPIKKSQKNFPEDVNFKRLDKMVRNGKLDIKLILANPRTGSTLLETSFIKNASVNTHIHEPFHSFEKAERVRLGYATIFEKVVEEAKTSPQRVRIIVKEIGRNLIIGDEYQRFLTLVTSAPIILIRNPLLSTESKIRTVLKSLGLRESASLLDVLWNYYARKKGYDEVNALISNRKDNGKKQNESQSGLQNKLLEYFAISKGFKDWQSMLDETFTLQDYKPFEDILTDERIYKSEQPATLEQMHYLQSIRKSFFIVDCTDYRLDPLTILTALCEKWNIAFSNNMIIWGHEGKKLHAKQADLKVWFERVQSSTRIDKPYEICPALSSFPKFIAKHIKDTELPAYYEMFKQPNRIKPAGASLQKQIDVPFSKPHRNGVTLIKLSIFYIDPIFSLMSNLRLISDKKFLKTNKRYLPTLNVTAKLINLNLTHSERKLV